MLAAFALSEDADLANFLNTKVFVDQQVSVKEPLSEDVAGQKEFLQPHRSGLAIVAEATKAI